MAISAITVSNDQHFAKGGVKYMEVAANNDGGSQLISAAGVVTSAPAAICSGTPVVFDFEKESAKMTVSMSKTDSLTLYTISIEGYIPKISGETLEQLHEFAKADGLRANVYCYDDLDKPYLVGWDNILAESAAYTDFPMVLESIEADSGSALQDQNGYTVKFTAVQATPPAQYD
ncbi:hypothetical protein [uncultured Mediterranean phage uvMED]|nr:hypothetical protein [uncultured Mediterranean phage uvMED]